MTTPTRDDARSPLLRDCDAVWEDAAAVAAQAERERETKSSWYLFLLTLSIGG